MRKLGLLRLLRRSRRLTQAREHAVQQSLLGWRLRCLRGGRLRWRSRLVRGSRNLLRGIPLLHMLGRCALHHLALNLLEAQDLWLGVLARLIHTRASHLRLNLVNRQDLLRRTGD